MLGTRRKVEKHDGEGIKKSMRNITSFRSQPPQIKRPNSLDFRQMPIPHCPRYPAYGVQNA